MKIIKELYIISVFYISGCSGILEEQNPVCTANAYIAGIDSTVQIYGVRKVLDQTQYRAGYPFNWRWVTKSNFTNSTCNM